MLSKVYHKVVHFDWNGSIFAQKVIENEVLDLRTGIRKKHVFPCIYIFQTEFNLFWTETSIIGLSCFGNVSEITQIAI